ncbi:MAG: CDP-glycerol glycerophosphotransferase family protein [Polyangiaceae bacterium]|nr:CDP-glycerol glycerophosphotransferase family protein [Polyangiaceae bacterium]
MSHGECSEFSIVLLASPEEGSSSTGCIPQASRLQSLPADSEIILVADHADLTEPRRTPLDVSPNGSHHLLEVPSANRATLLNAGMHAAQREWVLFVADPGFSAADQCRAVSRFLSGQGARAPHCLRCFLPGTSGTREEAAPTGDAARSRWPGAVELSPEQGSPATALVTSVNQLVVHRAAAVDSGLSFDGRLLPAFVDAVFAAFCGLCLPSTADLRWIGISAERGVSPARSSLAGCEATELLASLEVGCAGLAHAANTGGQGLPLWVQQVVLWQLHETIRQLLDGQRTLHLDSPDDRRALVAAFSRILRTVDASVIRDFTWRGVRALDRTAWLNLAGRAEPRPPLLTVDRYDPVQRTIRLRYSFCGAPPFEAFFIDDRDTIPAFAKTETHELLGHAYAAQRSVWLRVEDDSQRLTAQVGDDAAMLRVRTGEPVPGLALSDARTRLAALPPATPDTNSEAALLRRQSCRPWLRKYLDQAWLFVDRDDCADDNAEHLYRYVRRVRPDINAFFVLRRDSADWRRLKAEGFRLLPFGSRLHQLAFLSARHLVSSHADHYLYHPVATRHFQDVLKVQFTFLQHGVTQSNLSRWLNEKPIRCFITCSVPEHAAIAGNATPYAFGAREVHLTGFPRHDALLGLAHLRERSLLIMPTWRQWAVGASGQGGHRRRPNPHFGETRFARVWKAFLHSVELRRSASRYGYRIRFVPHPNLEPYLSWFEIPHDVEVFQIGRGTSVQLVLGRAALLLTDYSSIAFEMALLKRPVVYFQFDDSQVFGGKHTTLPGHFDFVRDGFGPVCETETATLAALERYFAADGRSEPMYRDRMEAAIAFRDGRNCERVLKAIQNTAEPSVHEAVSPSILIEYARQATRTEHWRLALSRWERVAALDPGLVPPDTKGHLSSARVRARLE